jgi:hypothetical protein
MTKCKMKGKMIRTRMNPYLFSVVMGGMDAGFAIWS